MKDAVLYLAWHPKPSIYQKLNPFWWPFDCTKPADAPFWEWNFRNRFHNLFGFVIGVEDRDHTFQGTAASDSIWNPAGGFNFGIVRCGILVLPLLSYRGKSIETYIGWRPIGAFDITFRKANSKDWTHRNLP
jgi:hypothetical protein